MLEKLNLFFRPNQHSLDCENISIKFNGIKLKPVEQVKYLGIYIDKYLSWNFHVSQVSQKLSRANGILPKIRYYVPIKTCLQIYYAIFYSHLIYGCCV